MHVTHVRVCPGKIINNNGKKMSSKRFTCNLILAFIFLLSWKTQVYALDPAVPGSYAVSTVEYKATTLFHDTSAYIAVSAVRAIAHYPTDLTLGSYPFVYMVNGMFNICIEPGNNEVGQLG